MKKKLLIISPKFHGYWKSIEAAFMALGYDVSTHRYDDEPTAVKAYNKVRYEVVSRLSGEGGHLSEQAVTRRAIAALRAGRPALVLVVRGDVLTDDFWQALDESNAQPLVWLYDELRRMSHNVDRLLQMPIASYSAKDVKTLQERGATAGHVPLAFDHRARLPPPRPQGEITLIGARYPQRETAMRALADAGLPVRAYGRDWSSHIVDRLRTFRLRQPLIPSGRDLPRDEAFATMRDSIATVNIHGDQDGFTMRTFEACGSGAVQLIDRPDVSEFFEPDREVLVFRSSEELVDLAQRVNSEPGRFEALREAGARRAVAARTFDHRAKALESMWG